MNKKESTQAKQLQEPEVERYFPFLAECCRLRVYHYRVGRSIRAKVWNRLSRKAGLTCLATQEMLRTTRVPQARQKSETEKDELEKASLRRLMKKNELQILAHTFHSSASSRNNFGIRCFPLFPNTYLKFPSSNLYLKFQSNRSSLLAV